MRRHQKSIANGQDRGAVDHDAIKERGSLSDQAPEERACENFSRVGRAPSTREDRKLTSGRRENILGDRNVLTDELNFTDRNLARG
jgi:hypothetical protein